MDETHMKERRRLNAMTEVLAMIADAFAREKKLETAVAAYVVTGMIVKKIETLEKALDKALKMELGGGDV